MLYIDHFCQLNNMQMIKLYCVYIVLLSGSHLNLVELEANFSQPLSLVFFYHVHRLHVC